MSVIIRITDIPVEKEAYRNAFVLNVHSISGRMYDDVSVHEFEDANDPLVAEAIKILTLVENEYDGILDDDLWDTLNSSHSEEAVQLVYDLIGGDITTDGDIMASLVTFDVSWFDDAGAEFETELEIEE